MGSVKLSYATRLPLWVILGAVFGVLAGIFFGENASVLRPVGKTYVMLMEAVVFPYIICSLIHGLGRLSPTTAWRLFRSSWQVYLMVWAATFFAIYLLSWAVPPVPLPSFIDATATNEGQGILELLIPANPFFDIVQNHLPAIVVFSIAFGIAIQRVPNKEVFLPILELIRVSCVTIWHWIVLLAPLGTFALFADSAGTIESKAVINLSLYAITILSGTFIVAFWALPSLIAALGPVSTQDILRDLQSALVIAVVTSLSVAALPFIQQATERLAERLGIQDEDRADVIKTTLAVSYPLGQLGNYFIWLFVLFAAFYYRVPISNVDQITLPFMVLLSGIGSPSSSIDAVDFLSSWLNFPSEATSLYAGMMTITRYGQVVTAVVGFAFISFLVTLNYYGKLRLHIPKLVFSLTVSVALLATFAAGGRFVQSQVNERDPPYLAYQLGPDITNGVTVDVEKPSVGSQNVDDDDPEQKSSWDPAILDRIQSSGELRVGYNPHIIPFSYENDSGQLVGFDIAYAYKLARDLNVRLRLVPFTWNNLTHDLIDRRYDMAVSGIYVTDERLRHFSFSDPYFQSPIALIVRSENAQKFLTREAVEAHANLKVAVFNDPVMIELAKRLLPQAEVIVLPSYDDLPKHPEIDVAIWTLAQAKAWAAPRINYTAVVPKDLGGQLFIAYLIPDNADQFRLFLDYWLRLQEANGFKRRMISQWIDGNPDSLPKPRWSIMNDVLGWGSD